MAVSSVTTNLVEKNKEYKTLKDAVLHLIRSDIISGELKPDSKIKADDLKKRYGVGTSPIREALFQLVSEGLVQVQGQRGFRVATISEAELLDITDWRVRMECEALRRSIEHGDVAWEAEALAAFHRLKHVQMDFDQTSQSGKSQIDFSDQWEALHREYHFALYRACGSPWLIRFCEPLLRHGERYRRAYIQYPYVTPSITQEHRDILELAIAREADQAVKLLEQHIRHAGDLLQRHVRQLPRTDADADQGEGGKRLSRLSRVPGR